MRDRERIAHAGAKLRARRAGHGSWRCQTATPVQGGVYSGPADSLPVRNILLQRNLGIPAALSFLNTPRRSAPRCGNVALDIPLPHTHTHLGPFFEGVTRLTCWTRLARSNESTVMERVSENLSADLLSRDRAADPLKTVMRDRA